MRTIALILTLAVLGIAAPASAVPMPSAAVLRQRSATLEPAVSESSSITKTKTIVRAGQPVTCESVSHHVDYTDPVFAVRWARFTVRISYCLTPNEGGCKCGGFVLSPNGVFGQPPVALVTGSTTSFAPTWRYVPGALSEKVWPVLSPWLLALGISLPYSAYGVWDYGEFAACAIGTLICRYHHPLIFAKYVEFFGGVDKWVTAT